MANEKTKISITNSEELDGLDNMNNSRYKDSVLTRFLWTRKNTINLFSAAQKSNSLNFKPHYKQETVKENHNLLYQFQCIITTTDCYFRKIKGVKVEKFGILIKDRISIKKMEIKTEEAVLLLRKQQVEYKKILSILSSEGFKNKCPLMQIMEDHEYLHQGQIIVMFRLTGIQFPETFKKAWDL